MGFWPLRVFDKDSWQTITELLVESFVSAVELANSIAYFTVNPLKIGV